MSDSPFSIAARAFRSAGHSPLPIGFGMKAPAYFDGAGRPWRPLPGWQKYCEAPADDNRLAHWARWPGANIGVALGRGVVAVDVDHEPLLAPLKAVLPPAIVAKRGRKGETWFYRVADATAFPSKGFRAAGEPPLALVDFLAAGRQTVCPPSIHPDTGAAYQWTTPRTLADTRVEELSVLTADHYAAMIEVLKAHGWEAEPERPPRAPIEPGADSGDDWRRVNAAALARLDAWAPKLGLARMVRTPGGFRSVASFRPSYSGKPDSRRERHLAINEKGIVDFGDGERGMTPIDLTMVARGLDNVDALRWLAPLVGVDLDRGSAEGARMAAALLKSKLTADPAEIALADEILAGTTGLEGSPGEAFIRALGLDPSALAHALGWAADRNALVGVMTAPADLDKLTGGLALAFLDGGRCVGSQSIGAPGVVRLTPDADVLAGLHVSERMDVALEGMAAGYAPMWVVDFATFPVLDGIECLTVIYGAANERRARALMRRWRDSGREVFEARAEPERNAA